MPQPREPGAGFPILTDAKHTTIYAATKDIGGYNHHAQLTWHDGKFYGMWSCHPHGEDGPGQRVLYATSPDAENWSEISELFPAPGPVRPSEQMGVVLTAFQWLELDGALYAVAGCHENIGFTDFDQKLPPVPERDQDHPGRARKGYSQLARSVAGDGALGPIFPFRDCLPKLAFPVTTKAETGARLAQQSTGERLPAWDFEGVLGYPKAVEGHRLCEPTVYRREDDKLVMLLRDCIYSHRMYCSVFDNAAGVWPRATPTDIPDSPSKSCCLRLDDGRILLIGNQMADAFDNPDEIKHHKRDPLTVAVSEDGGHTFNKVFALRCGVQQYRIENVKGRGGGGQYPSAIVHDGVLYVLYSMGKEDIAISAAALADLA